MLVSVKFDDETIETAIRKAHDLKVGFNDYIRDLIVRDAPRNFFAIGNAVRYARESKKMTQKELGLITGTSQQYISMIERGNISCTVASISYICQKLDARLTIHPNRYTVDLS